MLSAKPRIAIFGETPGWHCRELRGAFAELGVETVVVAAARCELDTSRQQPLLIAGFGGALPDGVIVRGIPAGSFEQVTFRLSLLHALDALGVPVYNSGRAIERSVDKAMTSFLLHRAGVPSPATWVCERRDRARQILLKATRQSRRVVQKPLFGSEGKGLVRLAAGDPLPPSQQFSQLHYLQQFVEPEVIVAPTDRRGAAQVKGSDYSDFRVLVIGGRARFAMRRRGVGWINNVAQGAHCEPVVLDAELKDLSERAAAALQIDYAGVDLIADRDGERSVLEVNGIPAWRGLQSVVAENIALALARDFVTRRLRAGPAEASG